MAISGESYLGRLPSDVLVDLVGQHLDVSDLQNLWQACVNQYFYQLTRHSIIWRQLLRKARLVLPPLAPTLRNFLEHLNGFELERLLMRAYSVDKIWNCEDLKPYHHWNFFVHTHVLSMVVLPGGQYLVASVTDDDRHHYGIMVYAMDHPVGGCIALAKAETSTKAYHLQAKYLSVQGKPGIAIAYVRRDFRHAVDRMRGINISLYGEDVTDPEVPLKYECQVLHISLSVLETLADTRIVPGSEEYICHAQRQGRAFKTLARIRTRSVLGAPALDELFGEPYIAVLKLPGSIVFQSLNGGPASALHCNNTPPYPDVQHTIMAVRPLPCQQQVLVVREIGNPHEGEYVVELFDILRNHSDENEEYSRDAAQTHWHDHEYYGTLSNVQISDHGIPTMEDSSVHAQLREHLEFPPAHPITIWAQRYEKLEDTRYGMHPYAYKGFMRIILTPKRHELCLPSGTMVTYSYSLDESIREVAMERVSAEYVPRILPGTYRSLIYFTPDDDRRAAPAICKIGRLCDPQLFAGQAGEADEESAYALQVEYPPEIDTSSVAALAWDQGIGRLCVAPSNSTAVHVLDFARAPRQGTFRYPDTRHMKCLTSRFSLDADGRRVPIPLEIDPDPDEPRAPLHVDGAPETEDEFRRRVEEVYATQLPWSHLVEAWQKQADRATDEQDRAVDQG
ncbi:hypothetical protein CERSUDRAFT_60469 [Gelatoporia subvermispora B]|uniref:F-box domain-containing protein n=1 Tax=Ceriporiopsis subvermispora (strain B) TaxID=914234 RepID=M2QX67_CERS8|nr:hypothetical protein CERSUDRAFT_60469 [Gelatoporia subvermispora B]